MSAIFGMNFQAVSVAQKVTKADVDLAMSSTPQIVRGGYQDAQATPTQPVETSLEYVDDALGRMVAKLSGRNLLERTLIVVGAEHGQSPIDVSTLHMPKGSTNAYAVADVTDPAGLLAHAGIKVTQETADDVSLIWLADHADAPKAAALSAADKAGANTTRIDTLLVVSNPQLEAGTIDRPVTNMQVAPTILRALGLDPLALVVVRREGTGILQGLEFDSRHR